MCRSIRGRREKFPPLRGKKEEMEGGEVEEIQFLRDDR